MSAKAVLDKTGVLSLFLIGACCLRLPVLFVLLCSIGLGLFARNAVLAPTMAGLLTLLLIGLAMDFRWHRHWGSLLIGAPGAVALYLFVFVERTNAAIYVALTGGILARILNTVVRRPAAKAYEA